MTDRLRAVTLPSSDAAFAAVVHGTIDDEDVESPEDLMERLRPLYPRIALSVRTLSGEAGPTWYIYRDGRYTPTDQTRWWADPETPAFTAGRNGIVTSCDARAAELLGGPIEEIIGASVVDLVDRDGGAAARRLLAYLLEHGVVETVIAITVDGRRRLLDGRAWVDGDRIEIRIRALGGLA